MNGSRTLPTALSQEPAVARGTAAGQAGQAGDRLGPAAQRAEVDGPLRQIDQYYDDGDPEWSTVQYESELAPCKASTDVVVIGKVVAIGHDDAGPYRTLVQLSISDSLKGGLAGVIAIALQAGSFYSEASGTFGEAFFNLARLNQTLAIIKGLATRSTAGDQGHDNQPDGYCFNRHH